MTTMFIEAPYISALKEEYLTSHCSSCFKKSSYKCPECEVIVYCNDECRKTDQISHQMECELYKNGSKGDELVLVRMIVRVITRLSEDGGSPSVDLFSNAPKSVARRSWSDLLGHRDEIIGSPRHLKEWLKTKDQIEYYFGNRFNKIDLLEIFGKLLINRFRVGIHQDPFNGRVAIGWAIYLTTSCFNHSCEPDLLQCSFDINMRLKFSNPDKEIPETTSEFYGLTVSYRHQNDFRLANPLSYVPTRKQRRNFVSFFFFNCHCSCCYDDLRNRYSESATNHLCHRCGDFLVLQNTYNDPTDWILTCLGRKKCLNNEQIVDRVKLSLIDDHEESIEVCEEKLKEIEELLHPQSILLLQQREKLFFTYQKLFNENRQVNLLDRMIQLGELLIEAYDIHLNQPSMYPKILLCDVASFCEIAGQNDRAKQLYEKAIDLWKVDYENNLDYQQLDIKL